MPPIIIRKHPDFDESALCEWKTPKGQRWYPLPLTRVFPVSVRHRISEKFYKSKVDAEINFSDFDYMLLEDVIPLLSGASKGYVSQSIRGKLVLFVKGVEIKEEEIMGGRITVKRH